MWRSSPTARASAWPSRRCSTSPRRRSCTSPAPSAKADGEGLGMAQYEMNLRDYWLIVRRRRMIIIVCTVLVAGSSFWFARQKVPQYTATAAVKFEQSTTLSGLLVEVLAVNGSDNIETQVSLIKSYPVLEEVARRMGKLPQTTTGEAARESRSYQATLDNLGGKVKASRVPSTSIIEIAVTSPNPREAKELANTVAEVYRDYNKANRNSRVTEARKFIEAQLREVAAQVAALRTREEILNRQMGDLLAKNREVPATELSLQRLQRDAKVNDDLLTLLKTRHQEALIKESEGIEEVSIVRPAADPTAPTGPETFNTMLVGGLLGLMLGLVLAFVQETLDTSIGTIEDVESYLGVRVLGIIPHIDPHETMQRLIERRPGLAQVEPDALQSHALLITHFDPKSPVAEAYRTLRTNIQFERMERGGKVLVVTSPTLQEGKTTTIVNLALTMAQNGQRTLLVGANMRRPSIYRFFGIEREPGLSDILVGNAEWRDCVRGVADILMGRFEMEDVMAAPGLDNLHIIEAGPIPPNPSELLSTTAMTEFLRAVAAEYDIVLIDTPPILPVTDSAIVAGKADGVLLVYQAGKVGRLVLKRAKAHLESARAQVWGVVLNDLQTEVSGYTYTHYYTHYYGEETPGEPPRGGGGRVQRAVDRARGWFGRGRGAAAAGDAAASDAAASDAADDAGLAVATLPPSTRAARREAGGRGRSRSLIIILAAVLSAVGALAAVVVWRFGGLDGVNPRELLRQRLSPSATPSAPPRPGAPSSTVTPTPPSRPAPSPAVTPPAATPPEAMPPAPPAPAAVTPPPAAPAPASPPPAAKPSTAITPPAVTPPPPAAPLAPATPPAPAAPSAVATSALTSPPAPVASALAAPPRASTPAARFAIEFGPFFSASEAEKLERRLTEAGYPTVRSRQPTGSAVYAVLIERVPTAHEGKTVAAALREQGLGEAVVVSTDPLVLRVGAPLPLRGAVELAERVRAAGHQVRVAAQPGEASALVVRHGAFPSRDEAEAKRRELGQLDLPAHQVVQVR